MAVSSFVIRPLFAKTLLQNQRKYLLRSYCTSHQTMKGLVLGVYQGEKGGQVELTNASQAFQASTNDQLNQLIQTSGLSEKGKQRIFYGLDKEYPSISVVSLGKKSAGYNHAEQVDDARENVRAAVAAGVKQLKEVGATTVHVDPCGDPEAAAEASHLCIYAYDELKAEAKKKSKLELDCYTGATDDPDSVKSCWQRGRFLAEGQNLAKHCMESPANIMTPTRFTEIAQEKLVGLDNVEVNVWDEAWAKEKKMASFLSVTAGSSEPAKFLQIQYNGGPQGEAPLAVVGKGVTFDSGGISIKASKGMEDMRADMGGAACTLGSIYTAARLKLPINIVGLMPLCENMPGNYATKPGDVITASNGKTIQVDNTDAEGRLILADALVYAETFKPSAIIDIATLTGGIMVALGSAATGVFTNSDKLWENMQKAGSTTGDRVWRMPLFRHYTKQVTEAHLADVCNSVGPYGSSCTAAAFLKEFVTNDNWMHMDIAGVAALMGCKSSVSYIPPTVTGRPTRTLVEFMSRMSKK